MISSIMPIAVGPYPLDFWLVSRKDIRDGNIGFHARKQTFHRGGQKKPHMKGGRHFSLSHSQSAGCVCQCLSGNENYSLFVAVRSPVTNRSPHSGQYPPVGYRIGPWHFWHSWISFVPQTIQNVCPSASAEKFPHDGHSLYRSRFNSICPSTGCAALSCRCSIESAQHGVLGSSLCQLYASVILPWLCHFWKV